MRTHTQQLKTNIKDMGRQFDSKITYGNIELKEELYRVNPVVESNLLKSVMKQLEIESSVDIPLGTVINYQLGVLVNGSYEYLNYGNYVVYDSQKIEDSDNYLIICYDKMIYAMKKNELFQTTYPVTIKNYLSNLATKIGLTLKDTTFKNQSLSIMDELYVGLEYTYRDILDEIAQATGSMIIINNNDELEVIYPTETNDTIDEEYLKDTNVKFGQKYGPINSIVLSRAEADNVYLRDDESVLANGLCEVKIVDNQIMNGNNRSDFLEGILEALDGLEYYVNDFTSTGILYYEVGDLYNIKVGENTYKSLMLNDDIELTQGLTENIYAEIPEQSETDYTKADKTDRKLNQTTLIVDKQNQQIQSIVSEIGDRSEKTTTITQDIDGIASAVGDLEDLTKRVTGTKTITINDAYPNADILELHIYGNNSVFSYLYPADDLYPSDTLYPYGDSRIRFYNSQEDRTIKLGIDEVLRANAETRDELSIVANEVKLIRRVNPSGTTKPVEEVTELGTLNFRLVEGDNTFEIVNYNAPIEIVYATKSNLTNLFATKVEMNSEITQTAEEINLEVRKKVDENEVISKINQSAEEIQIEANKISLAR